MQREDALEGYVRGGLAEAGVPVDEVEMAIIIGVWRLFRPAIVALRDADLPPTTEEREVDLSRGPAG